MKKRLIIGIILILILMIAACSPRTELEEEEAETTPQASGSETTQSSSENQASPNTQSQSSGGRGSISRRRKGIVDENGERKHPVDYFDVIQGSIIDYENFIGDVESDERIIVLGEVRGKVASFSVNIGDRVRSGTILGYIDPSSPGQTYRLSPVLATATGVISDLPLKVGSALEVGSVFAEIVDLNKLKVDIFVAEKYYAKLKEGMNARISFSKLPGKSFEAKVKEISPVFDRNTRTVKASLALVDPEHVIRPGMYAQVRLIFNETKGILKIPSSAVTRIDGISYVYVIDPELIMRRVKVELGVVKDDQAQILSGLNQGDRIVKNHRLATEGGRAVLVNQDFSIAPEHVLKN